MKYRGLFIEFSEASGIEREDKNGNTVVCGGYNYSIYSDDNAENFIDEFSAAVGFELPDSSRENAELFAKEMVDSEYKEYCRIINDLNFGSITM